MNNHRLAAIAVVLLSASCFRPLRVAREPVKNEATLKVVTWNVNYGVGGAPDAFEQLERATRDADLVLLQETNATWEANVRARLTQRFPHQFWLDDAAAGGQAVLSRRAFEHEVLPPTSGWFAAIRLESETKLGRVQVLSVHLHPPISDSGGVVSGYLFTGQTRRHELEDFVATLDPKLRTLIVGDFNESTQGDAIEWAAKRGFRSALPEFAPAADTWKWPLTKSLQLSAQFDHVLYSRGLAPLSASVLKLGRSDHFPVAVVLGESMEIDLPPARGTSLGLTSAGR